MNSVLLCGLTHCETDIAGSLKRFAGNEEVYTSYLEAFPKEPTMSALDEAVASEKWDKAFIAAHALKGLAANLGFVPLYHAIGELVVVLRDGRTDEIARVYQQTRQCYENVVAAIECTDVAKD